ncbi:unnamed protein product [Gongylonema pulchrum]|uniref:Uncharacterized protein n=1 Tax=Gongylonema pulchrum TaxID=637853 RepID=A0A3P7PBF5_9BILA|nr:unnamed protein product [Gongylonema pulchrum]
MSLASRLWDYIAVRKWPRTLQTTPAMTKRVASMDDWLLGGAKKDGTVVTTKSGRTFPTDEHDWRFFSDSVPQTLATVAAQNFRIVFFTNQRALFSGDDQSSIVQVFVSLGSLQYRKPCTGMWEHFEKYENGGISINRQCSFYVGDAAGRICSSLRGKKDHSAADRLFALNIGINFFTPEQYFLKQTHIENYILPSFSPSLSLDAKLCLFEPEYLFCHISSVFRCLFIGYAFSLLGFFP